MEEKYLIHVEVTKGDENIDGEKMTIPDPRRSEELKAKIMFCEVESFRYLAGLLIASFDELLQLPKYEGNRRLATMRQAYSDALRGRLSHKGTTE